mmetsp:Transcript_20788/g.49135  ORF Transcript_20788/g.49135 Transcript_20788/m.49135 type:complete len:282 (+) Transcript_20788:305-1150(+)
MLARMDRSVRSRHMRMGFDRHRSVGIVRHYVLHHFVARQRLVGICRVPHQPNSRGLVILIICNAEIVRAHLADVVFSRCRCRRSSLHGGLILQHIVVLKVGHVGIFILVIVLLGSAYRGSICLGVVHLSGRHLILHIAHNLPLFIQDVKAVLQFLLAYLGLLFDRHDARDQPVLAVTFVVDMGGAITARGDGILQRRYSGGAGNVARNQVLLVEREVALGLGGVASLPAPRRTLVHQLVTGGNEFFRREHSPTEEGRRLERWGGPLSDGFEVRAHCADWER